MRAARAGSRAKAVRQMLLAVLAIAATYVVVAIAVNRSAVPRSGPVDVAKPAARLAAAGNHIVLATWNLAYGGLGADMDFVADGGTRYLPRSKDAVIANVSGIVATLKGIEADVFLFQEMARASPLNLQVDVLAGVAPRFENYAISFDPEVATRLLPPPLRLAHGTAIYSRFDVAAAERRIITLDNEVMAGLLTREYRMHVVRLPISGSAAQWVVVNVHLAAFDDGALVRRKQLADVLAFARQEFTHGNAVIVGGDWNLEFVRNGFPHTTAAKDRFWLHDFPLGDLPRGWTAAFDPSVPSVRTVHKPYVAGENYVSVVDGYIVSPNVTVEQVRGIALGFRHSDHQPVVARFALSK